jgi:putative tryptophan/tyrosine transport system substrate-binding protein
MKRREFLAAAASAALLPSFARTQQPTLPIIGFLSGQSAEGSDRNIAAFHNGLKEAGLIDRQNVTIEYRWAEDRPERLPVLAADLARRAPAVLVAAGGDASARAARVATQAIPLVVLIGADPVQAGFARSLNAPGGNVTGITVLTSQLIEKRLGLVRELVPKATAISLLTHPDSPNVQANAREAAAAAQALGFQLHLRSAKAEGELASGFAASAQDRAAVVVSTGSYFLPMRDRLLALAASHAVPVFYDRREFVTAGGLASYGVNIADTYRHLGVYAGQIVKGGKAGELPFLQPTQFELALNLKAAKTLGLAVPPTLLATADEVIE